MPHSQKVSSFDPTSITPKVLIVSCTADISYVDHLHKQYFNSIASPQRAIDFMEFLHPGAFPVDESLDAIVEVMARFAIPEIAIISHIDCGLVDALAKFSQIDQIDPYLFNGYAKAVTKMLKEFSIGPSQIADLKVGQVTTLLSNLVAIRVAKHLHLLSQSAKQELGLGNPRDKDNCERLSNLSECHITPFSFLGVEKGLVENYPRFKPRQWKETILL